MWIVKNPEGDLEKDLLPLLEIILKGSTLEEEILDLHLILEVDPDLHLLLEESIQTPFEKDR